MTRTSGQSFRADGVICVRGALDAAAMKYAEDAFQWSLDHPGPGAGLVLRGTPGAFYQDHANPDALGAYRALLAETGLDALVAGVLESESLWLLYEQIWLKEAGAASATPWHQDLPYVPLAGAQLATVWLNLDPVAQRDSLNFVPGSHLGPLYNPTAFDAANPAAAMFAEGVWPSLPDIEATRACWPIVAWDIAPGDLVIFHPAILHGGAPTRAGTRRRTISLRFFGDDAHCAARPSEGLAVTDQPTFDDGHGDPMVDMARQPPGTPFRHAAFPRLR